MIAALFTSSCTYLGLRAVNFPSHFKGYDRAHNIVFQTDHGLKMDIYAPVMSESVQYPVMVFFYGGRWTTGRRQDYRFIADQFVKRGYVVVIPDYRKYPDVKFPAFVEDGAAAVNWVHENIAGYGGDTEQIVIAGHSAGAHIGALMVADQRYLDKDVKVKAFAGLAGPYAFIPDEPDLVDMFGPEERYSQIQVPTFVNGYEPPMLLQYGEQDELVGAFNHERLELALLAKNRDVQVVTYPEFGHVDLLTALSWVKDRENRVADDMDGFFKYVLDDAKNMSHRAEK